MNQIINFTKGMQRDIHPRSQIEGSYRDALNAVLQTDQGQLASISTELGTSLCVQFPAGYQVIGSINTDSDDIVVFLTNDTISKIVLYNAEACKYQELVTTSCLGFKKSWPIHGVFKVRRGCERFIYFTDGHNPIRVINIDNLSSYLDNNGTFDCSLTQLNLPFQLPEVDVNSLNSGGSLEVGAYQFVFRYKDNDGNTTDWSYPTLPIMITDDSISSNWTEVNGAQNILFYTAQEGGVPRTSKSIRLNFTNLDLRYTELEIAVLRSVEGLRTFTSVENLTSLRISGSNGFYTYTGSSSQVTQELTINEVITPRDNLQIAETMVQLDHSLWLGNVKTAPYDYAEFQRAALGIVLTPKLKQVTSRNPTQEHNPKNPKPFSYMGGEVYSFSIIYHFKDGFSTDAFHIVGAEATGNERDIQSTWTPDMAHIVDEDTFNNTYAKSQLELDADPTLSVVRFYEIKDTSTRDGNDLTWGYFENKGAVYPDTEDCSGTPIWGDLAGQPIRHHKFPSRRTVSIMEEVNGNRVLNVLGFEVSGVTYPHPDIIGHTIVRALRTDDNKTILDKGVLSAMQTNSAGRDIYIGPTGAFQADLANSFISPKIMVDDALPGGNHFFLEQRYNPDTYSQTNTFTTPGIFNGNIDITTITQAHYFEDLTDAPDRCNYAFDDTILLDRDSVQTAFGNFDRDLHNKSGVAKVAAYHIQEDADDGAGNYGRSMLASLKTTNDVYANLESLVFIPVVDHPQFGTQTQEIFTGADTVITAIDKGDIYNTDDGGFLNSAEFVARNINGFWVESEYNWNMLHEGTEGCNTIYDLIENPNFYWIGRIADENDNGDYLVRNAGDVCYEYYNLNKDFTKQNIERPAFVLPFNYNYCSDCLNHYPNRIYYSRRDDLESLGDSYRNFLVNSYRNLDTLGDSIQKLVTDKAQLYAMTTSYIYFIPTNSQEIKTDENIAYLGTGDRLSIAPTRLVTTDYKYGGTTQKHSVITTQFGTFYTDDKSGKVFKIAGSLEEISSLGMSQFFEDNLPMVLNTEIENNTDGEYWIKDSTAEVNGVGIKTVFDPRLKRLIIHKKDYKPLYPIKDISEFDSASSETIFVDLENQRFVVKTAFNSQLVIQLTDLNYFEDISWTISFSLDMNVWSSFHSYHPHWSFNNHNYFFSTQENHVYNHNGTDYTTYYGVKYPHFVETVVNDKQILNKTLDSIAITGDTYEDDSYICDTFNKVWAYTPRQSSGVVNLEIMPASGFAAVNDNDTLLVRENKDKYYFNGLRNRLNSLPSYREGLLHREPVNIGNVSFYNQARIKGDYIFLRLVYDNLRNYRINTHSLLISYTNSNR